jgi:hypothetical protein
MVELAAWVRLLQDGQRAVEARLAKLEGQLGAKAALAAKRPSGEVGGTPAGEAAGEPGASKPRSEMRGARLAPAAQMQVTQRRGRAKRGPA